MDSVSYHIFASNRWEIANTRAIITQLKNLQKNNPNKTVFFMDVGANIGWFTFAVASTGTHVIAFEPFSNNIKAIKSSMCSNLEIAPLIHL